MQAVQENRYIILAKDFEKAYKKAIKDDQEHDFYKYIVNQLLPAFMSFIMAVMVMLRLQHPNENSGI